MKWKDLSYNEATWESERRIETEKIEEFKLWNKIPPRDIRERFDVHNKIHNYLLEQEILGDRRGVQNTNIQKMETKLYLLE